MWPFLRTLCSQIASISITFKSLAHSTVSVFPQKQARLSAVSPFLLRVSTSAPQLFINIRASAASVESTRRGKLPALRSRNSACIRERVGAIGLQECTPLSWVSKLPTRTLFVGSWDILKDVGVILVFLLSLRAG